MGLLDVPEVFDQAKAIRDVYYHSIAALSVLSWDCLSTFEDEVRYIWPMKIRYPFKWLYLLLRYLPLAAQISHQYILSSMSSDQPCYLQCKIWHMYMIALVLFTSAAVEFILAFRVYALFSRQLWVALFLGCLILAECCCAFVTLWSRFCIQFVQACIFFPLLPVSKIHGCVSLATQSMLVTMALLRRFVSFRARFSKLPIVIMLIRDGTVTYLTMLGLLGCSFVIVQLAGWQPVVMFFWTATMQSACGSRLILNIARLPKSPSHQGDRGVMLTSQVDLYFSRSVAS
ncbi:hypothetical protein J3A83DRAFT_4214800 [Scleroderma citrinum]